MSRGCWGHGPYAARCQRDVEHTLDPATPHRYGTTTWPQRVYRQDDDGNVYLGFYSAPYAFIWDGMAGFIEVSEGGMGEPITATFEAPRREGVMTAATMLEAFQLACHEYLAEEAMD